MTNQNREQYKIYKNVFDEFTMNTLYKLSSQGHFEELVSPVMIGKESNVFIAEKSDESYVIVKIYRLASCNFNKMYSYIKSDPRFMEIKNQRRQVIFKWVQREYRNLLIAREVINVPTPLAFSNNVLVMESIGDDMPAQQLKDDHPKDKEDFLKQVVDSVIKLGRAGIVHADLSEFNILNLRQKPYFIDFSQGTSIKDSNAEGYMRRDIDNIVRFFTKIGLKKDSNKLYEKIIKEINKKPITNRR
jgi:RIO kinase 1